MKAWWKTILLVVVAFALIMVGVVHFVRPLFAEHFESLTSSSKAQAFPVYVVTAVAVIAFAVPIAALVMSAAGFLFGLSHGSLVAVVCMTIGTFLTFLFARRFLRNHLSRKYSSEIAKIDAGLKKHGLKYFLFLRISPFPPVSITTFAMGMTNISVWNFLWISLVGLFPSVFLYAYLGSQLASLAQFR